MRLFCQFALCPVNWWFQVCGQWGREIRQVSAFLSKSSVSFEGAAFPSLKGEWASASAFPLPAYTVWETITAPREAASYSRLGTDCFSLKQ